MIIAFAVFSKKTGRARGFSAEEHRVLPLEDGGTDFAPIQYSGVSDAAARKSAAP